MKTLRDKADDGIPCARMDVQSRLPARRSKLLILRNMAGTSATDSLKSTHGTTTRLGLGLRAALAPQPSFGTPVFWPDADVNSRRLC